MCLLSLQTVLTKDDEFYCAKDKFKDMEFCQTCNKKEWDPYCNLAEECKCSNVRVKVGGQLKGGVEDCKENGWCYVTDPWLCTDTDYPDYYMDNFDGELFRSSEACTKTQDNTGNEAELKGIKILNDRLRNIENGTLTDELTFIMEDSTACKAECDSRKGQCGAWSYDKKELICYLHTVDSCCGQFGKREINEDFVSGYACNACWSTKSGTECPCSVEDRLGTSSIKHCNGCAKPSIHNGPGALLAVIPTKLNPDHCKCERRFIRGRCRCIKKQCKNDTDNQNGTCTDQRRCRAFAISEERFPKC